MNYKINKDTKGILKNTSRTLYLSFSILPDYVRYMLSYGYLIARAMDSIVDNNKIPLELKNKFIERMFDIGKPSFNVSDIKKDVSSFLVKWEKILVDNIDVIINEFIKNCDEDDKRNLIMLIKGISYGMMIDLKRFGNVDELGFLLDFRELKNYSFLIGGVPAIYWFNVYQKYMPNVYKNNVLTSAYKIGAALQLTNILKDMRKDIIYNKRSYIPLEFLKSANLNNDSLLDYRNIEKVKPFINSVILTCIDWFDESEYFIESIKNTEFSLKIALIWPIYWAMDSLYLVSTKNPLKTDIKISRINVYKTLLKSPLLISSTNFRQGYRFRRETLILSIKETL